MNFQKYMNLTEKETTPLEMSDYMGPTIEDFLLTDLKDKDLKEDVARELNVTYLGETNEEPSLPVSGIIWGINRRPLLNLIVCKGSRRVNVIFLVITGSPNCFISSEVLKALKIEDTESAFYVDIHGEKTLVNLSSNNFKDVNILGTHYLQKKGLDVTLDYGALTLTISTED